MVESNKTSHKTAQDIVEEIQDLRQIIAGLESDDSDLEELKEQLRQKIKDHKQDEEEIALERNKLNSILGAMQSGVTIMDLDYTLTYQNDFITKIYGDRTGEKCYHVFEGNEQICEGCPVELAFKDGQSHTSVRQVVSPSGETTYWQNTANPVKDADGNIVSCVEVNTNITENKKAEEALRKSEEHFRLLYDRSPLGYQSLDADGNIIEVNPAWLSLLGYEKEEVIGRSFADFLSSGYPEFFKERFPCFKASGEACSVPFVMVSKDGRDIDVDIDGKIGCNPDGSFKQTHCIVRDVSKRKKAEKELWESERRYRVLVEGTESLVTRVDNEGKFIYVNQASRKFFGLEPEECIGLSSFDFIHPDDRESTKQAFETWVCDNTEDIVIENRQVSRTGEVRDVLWTCNIIFDESGQVVGVDNIAQDITERKKAEEALEMESYRLAKAQEIGSIGTWEMDILKNKLSWTKENHNIFGIPDGTDMTYETFMQCVHPDDREYVNAEWMAGVDGKPYDIEHRIVVNGKIKWVREKAELIFDDDGKAIRAVGVTQDITERKRAEEELSLRLEFENLISRISADFINIPLQDIEDGIDRTLGLVGTFINADRCYVFEFDKDQKYVSNTYEWCGQGIAPEMQNLENIEIDKELPFFSKIIRKKEAFHVPSVEDLPTEAILEKGHFKAQNIQALVVTPMISQNNIIGFVGFDSVTGGREWQRDSMLLLRSVGVVIANILEKKKAEEKLREAKHEAESASIAKSQFLANMSHEIRTPMNVITGFANLLGSEEDPNERKSYVDIIQKSSKSLLRIIDEILDVSRIEAGKFEIKIEDCSLSKLLDGVEVMMRPLVKDKGLQFDIFRSTTLPSIISTDCGRVRQCLINLINNAIKFTKEGYVHLKVSMEEKQDKPFIRFDVEDTGMGVPRNEQETIFETFTQVDGSYARQYGGTGLGLSITSQIAGLLGGDIFLTSEEGKGSVFSLLIPAGSISESLVKLSSNEQVEDETVMPESTHDIQFSGKIVVAEDDKGCQVLIGKLLKKLGFDIVFADNGKEVVEKILQESFDLILMDIQMPYMTGFEATKVLREKGVRTPIVALTAHAMEGDREKCLEAGCDDYLSKPIETDELRRVLKKFVGANSDIMA
ncbi:MAG: PAS domain S-box protein [Phycisphaerae bacterium]|nr:PAS domain S-box protein [Phycisphaerae bacterium]